MSVDDPLRSAIARLCDGGDLDAGASAAATERLMSGEATAAQIGGYLAALRVKGETVEEVVGAARAMRARCERVQTRRFPLVDTCGTGGDGGRTFSISTAAALVVAGAGVAVAKHGNRAASGRFGGADVLEALGVRIDQPAQVAGRCLDETGIAFLFARRLHPAMRHVAEVRRELGVRTIFNLLGPLTNPAGATRQVVGVSAPRALALVAGALRDLGCEHGLVVHSRDGLDEISLGAACDVIEVRDGKLSERILTPEDFGLGAVRVEDLSAPALEDSVIAVRAVLDGAPGPRADVVVANASAALWVAGRVSTLVEGVAVARDSIASGAAQAALDALVAFTASVGDDPEQRARV